MFLYFYNWSADGGGNQSMPVWVTSGQREQCAAEGVANTSRPGDRGVGGNERGFQVSDDMGGD